MDDKGGLFQWRFDYYRPTILVLLKQQDSHGYGLVTRMAELCFDEPVTSNLYRLLRCMEADKLVASCWDTSATGGPPRRMYALTDAGERVLCEVIPSLVQQRRALDAVLDLYLSLDRTGRT